MAMWKNFWGYILDVGVRDDVNRKCGYKVVHYCSQEHQTVDRVAHKTFCNRIKKERVHLEAQDVTLRAHPGNIDTPPNAFEKGGEGDGSFWGFKGARKVEFCYKEATITNSF
jgi:hypothetical protein